MSKILKNTTIADILVGDVGLTIPASSQITIQAINDLLWADSSDIVTNIGSGDVVVNDGTSDLTKAEGIKLIHGLYRSDVITEIKADEDLKSDYTEMIGLLSEINKELKIMNIHNSIITGEDI